MPANERFSPGPLRLYIEETTVSGLGGENVTETRSRGRNPQLSVFGRIKLHRWGHQLCYLGPAQLAKLNRAGERE